MSNFIKFLFVSFVLPSIFFTQTASALLSDGSVGNDTTGNESCLNLQYNLSFGKRDAQTKGEVTKLQTFLHDNGYLTANPTGYFGLQTKNAVRALQVKALIGVQANNIDSSLITSAADRQELASSNFVLSNTGYAGMYTRTKIAYISCSGNGNGGGSNTSTFTYSSNIAGLSPLYTNFAIDVDTKKCLSESGYSVDYGDGQSEIAFPNWLATTNGVISANDGQPCLGYFTNHTYQKEGKYTAKLMKNTCPAGAQCFVGPKTVATLTVNVGGTSGATDLIQGPSTCTVTTYDSGSMENTLAAANGNCEITLTWPNVTAPLSSKLIKWQLDGSKLWSGNVTLADDTLSSKSKKFTLGQSKITVVISSNDQDVATKVISGVCASGASRDTSSGRCVTTPGYQEVTSPTITTTSLPNATVGQTYTYGIASTGGTGTRSWTTTGPLPTGMQLNQTSCITSPCSQPETIGFTGSPTTAGSYTFTATVITGTQSFSKVFTIVVTGSNNCATSANGCTTPGVDPVLGGNLVITTPKLLPAIRTRQAITGIKFAYTGGDGSMPIWSNCQETFVGINYPDINPYGYLIGAKGYNGTLAEEAVCAKVKVGSQIAMKSFVLPIIQDPKLSLSIVTAPNLHSGIVGRKYVATMTSSNDSESGYDFEMNNGSSCNRSDSWSVSSGPLPPGLSFHSVGDAYPGGGIYGSAGIEGVPTTPGTYHFTVTENFVSGCTPVSSVATKDMTIVISNPASGDMNAPKLTNFKVQVMGLANDVDRWGYLRSNSSFVVSKSLGLRFTVNTDCRISREAQYYVFNVDGVDQTKDGQKVKYDIKDINLLHYRNQCENNGGANVHEDIIEVTPVDLGLSEGNHNIVIRGCTADDICSPVSDGVPLCTLARCITVNELDEHCVMWGDTPCSHNPLVTMPAFVLKVGPSIPKAYTTKYSTHSTDFSLVENAIGDYGSIYLLGLDRNASPSVCQDLPGSTACAIGQGKYTPIVTRTDAYGSNFENNFDPGNFAFGAVREPATPIATTEAEYTTSPLNGRYDWYVRYPGGSPIKLGGYTVVPNTGVSDYKWQCGSDYGIVKGSFLYDEARVDDTTTGTITAVTPSCNASQRGGNDAWPYVIDFKDTNNHKVSCMCYKIAKGRSGSLMFATQSQPNTSSSLSQTLIPNQTKVASILGQSSISKPAILGASTSNTSCTDIPRNLIRGTESSFVTKLQNFLLTKGLLTDTPTGFYGDKTVQAVKEYQAMKGLPQTGMVYDFTRSAIKAESCK